jgi:hypothetical protein
VGLRLTGAIIVRLGEVAAAGRLHVRSPGSTALGAEHDHERADNEFGQFA